MADFTALKATIQQYIKQNGNEEITGAILQDVLLSMVNTMGDGAINTLTQNLSDEITARGGADSILQGNIDSLGLSLTALATFVSSGYIFRGIANQSTVPSTLNGKVFYLTSTSGQYSHMGNITVQAGISALLYDGAAWSAVLLIAMDNAPTEDSGNMVKSGGVHSAIASEAARALAAETKSVEFNSTTKNLIFKNSAGTVLYQMDASVFVIDGMVQNVEIKDVTISGQTVTCLVISFNTDAGKQDINIPLTQIFNPANYYDKTAIDNLLSPVTTRLNAGYLYMGLATVAGTPDTSKGKVFYLTATAGTYTNYGNTVVADGLTILSYDGSAWTGTLLKGLDSTPTQNSTNLITSGGVQNELALGAVYDVSAKNPTAGPNNDGKWESLSALLSDANLNTLIPTSVRKGGMSIKFVQSSDNKYVQYRLMADEFTTDTTKWAIADEGVYVENPEYIKAVTDSNGKLIESISIDGTKVIYGDFNVKGKFNNKDTEEKFDTKVDKVLGKSLIDEDFASSQEAIVSPEYVQVTTDQESKILGSVKKDGSYSISGNLNVGKDISAKKISAESIKINESIILSIDAKESLRNDINQNPFYNKTCLYIGDSISTEDYHGGWKGLLESKYGLKYVRGGVGLLWPANGGIEVIPPQTEPVSDEEKSIWYRCAENRMSIYNFDMISLFGGTNDMRHASLNVGDLDNNGNYVNISDIVPYVDDADSFSSPSDYTDTWSSDLSFAQCLMGCLEMLHRDFPSKPIMLCTVMPCAKNSGYGTAVYSHQGSPMDGVILSERLAIISTRIAEFYFNKGWEIYAVPFYWGVRTTDSAAAFTSWIVSQQTVDGVHPNRACGIRMVNMVRDSIMM